MTCGIYKITRKDTGQMYIGLSENIEKRYRAHANGNDIKCSRIDRAMVKYGEDKFDVEIIEELPNDRTLLMEREEYWVKYYDTYEDKNHYNLTPGGDVCPSKLPEIQAKISEAVSGKNHYLYGKKLPENTRKKISKALSGENNPMFGKKHSEESIKKMSAAKSGENHPMFGKLGEKHPRFGCKHTPEAKKKYQKHTILLDTIVFIKRKTLHVNKVLYGDMNILKMEDKKGFLALILKNLKKKSEPKDLNG